MSYLVIAPPSEVERSEISTTTVTQEVLRRWPDAELSMDASGPFTTRWWAMNKRFEGKLYRHGRGVVVDGPFEVVLDFAIWVRRAIGRDVVFTDLGNDGVVEVRASMTADELDRAYTEDVERNRRVWYRVIPPPGSELATATVTAEVDRRWPDAKITVDAWGPLTMWWSAKSMGHFIDGKISRERGDLSIAGPFEQVVDFAIWVRAAVGRDVAFSDDRKAGSVEVTAEMTADELATAYKHDVENNR